MSLGSISRATFAVEAAILFLLGLESLGLLARSVSNLSVGFVFAIYFFLMLAASISLVVIAIEAFQARSVRASNRWRKLFSIGLAGAVVASVVFALAAYFAEPDEGNISVAAVHYLYAPFLFFWLPLIHAWIESRRRWHLSTVRAIARQHLR
jgi:hypothetical protein